MPGNEPPLITLDSIQGNFYGGYPFVANWNFNNGDTPSTLTMSVVNSQGIYSINDSELNFQNTVNVGLGSFSFNGYLVSYEIEESAQQKILTLHYIDKSINLERWSIGLDGRHGFGSNVPLRMILVGREYSPCRDNLDSTQDFSAWTTSKIDLCDPCPNFPANGYENACNEDAFNLKIDPVYYTFNELLSKLGQTGLSITPPSQITGAMKNHRAQHVGTVKSVLSTWCSELGLAYYFDPVQQKLVFISRSQPIQIPPKNTLRDTNKTISLKYGSTIENTFSRGFIGFLGTQGEIKKYNCEREDSATLFCLTLNDLFTDDNQTANITTFNAMQGGSYDSNYTYQPPPGRSDAAQRSVDTLTSLYYATVLAYYPTQLRLSFLWFFVLRILNPTGAKAWRTTYTAPGASSSTPSGPGGASSSTNSGGTVGATGSTITELGNMNIVAVFSKQDSTTSSYFDALAKTGAQQYGPVLPESYLEYVRAQDIAEGRDPEANPSFYFVLAQCNLDLFHKQEERDVYRAKQFLGRYYYRSFDKMAVAGGSNDNAQLHIDAAGASCAHHPRGSYLQHLPIFSFGHSAGSRIGRLVNAFSRDDSDNIASIGTPTGANAEKYRNLSSFILLDRGDAAKYSPDESEHEDWRNTWEWYKNIAPQLIGNDGRPDILIKVLDRQRSGADSSLKLFVCRELGSFDVIATNMVANPWDANAVKIRHNSYEGLDGNSASNGSREHPANGSTDATYGLMSPNTVEIRMPGGLTIYPPSQSLILSGQAHAGFRVFILSSSKYQKIIPKFQKVVFKDAPSADLTANVSYTWKQLDGDNVMVLGQQQSCLPTDSNIQTYVNKFGSNMAMSNSVASKKANLKVIGIMPQTFTVAQGLSSVQITVGDNGVYTDYTFEDKVVVPPSEDIIQEELIRQNRMSPVMGSSLTKMTTQQYTDVGTAVTAASSFNTNTLSIT